MHRKRLSAARTSLDRRIDERLKPDVSPLAHSADASTGRGQPTRHFCLHKNCEHSPTRVVGEGGDSNCFGTLRVWSLATIIYTTHLDQGVLWSAAPVLRPRCLPPRSKPEGLVLPDRSPSRQLRDGACGELSSQLTRTPKKTKPCEVCTPCRALSRHASNLPDDSILGVGRTRVNRPALDPLVLLPLCRWSASVPGCSCASSSIVFTQ